MQDKIVFGAFFLGAIICLGLSFAFHTLCCHSETVGRLFSKYVATFIRRRLVTTFCRYYYILYVITDWIIVELLSWSWGHLFRGCIMVSIATMNINWSICPLFSCWVYAQSSFRWWTNFLIQIWGHSVQVRHAFRALTQHRNLIDLPNLPLGVFASFGLSGIIPAIHYGLMEGWFSKITRNSLGWLVLMGQYYVQTFHIFTIFHNSLYLFRRCFIHFGRHVLCSASSRTFLSGKIRFSCEWLCSFPCYHSIDWRFEYQIIFVSFCFSVPIAPNFPCPGGGCRFCSLSRHHWNGNVSLHCGWMYGSPHSNCILMAHQLGYRIGITSRLGIFLMKILYEKNI